MGTVVLVTVSNLFIGGFTIQRSGEPNVGIAVVWSNNNTIDGNVIINNQFGIWLNFSDNNEVRGNVVANNIWDGIFLLDSNNNTVTTNTIFGCERGIRMEGSNHNVVKRNNVTDNHTGLAIGLGYNDTVTENTFSECLYGISLFKSGNDLIYHNNLINNQDQASTYRSYDNSWDDGYPSGGNYWSNYNGTDIDLDGIGDSRYIIDANNVDNHPLMGRFYSYCIPSDFGQGLGVTIVSNSTVSNFSVGKVVAIPIINSTSINSDGWKVTSGTRIIMFNISGETGLGFCRLCIPKALMAPPYTVAINRGPASPIYYNEKMFDNSTHRWIYFTYSHLTTHEVWIVGQKDTTPPVITLLSPKNRTYTSSFIPLTLTLNEPTSWVGYSLNGEANVTIMTGAYYNGIVPFPSMINTSLFGLSDGPHSLTVYANDTSGNMGSSDTVSFTVCLKTLLGTGWGWMRIDAKESVCGKAELYKVGDEQIELVITCEGGGCPRVWNITYHRDYENGERYVCYSNGWGFLIVGFHKHRRWQFWYAVGKGVIAFGFHTRARWLIYNELLMCAQL